MRTTELFEYIREELEKELAKKKMNSTETMNAYDRVIVRAFIKFCEFKSKDVNLQ